MIRASLLLNGAGLMLALLIASGTAMAHPRSTATTLSFSSDGGATWDTGDINVDPNTLVKLRGHVACVDANGHTAPNACPASMAGFGTIKIEECKTLVGGLPTGAPLPKASCPPLGTVGDWAQIASGAPDASGNFDYDLLVNWPGQTFGFRAHYVSNGAGASHVFGQSQSTAWDIVDDAADCTKDEDSVCAGLSQGAYGNWNTIATCLTAGCNPWNSDPPNSVFGAGFVPAAKDAGNNVFTGDSNATTIGVHNTRSITIGPQTTGGDSSTFSIDRQTLITLLPISGTPQAFDGSVVGFDDHYDSETEIPFFPLTGGDVARMKKRLGGELASQAMTTSLNSYLSGVAGGLQPGGFKDFTVGEITEDSDDADTEADRIKLLCTERTSKEATPGLDGLLGTSDDGVNTTTSWQASRYPNCVAGKKVSEVLAAANSYLAGVAPSDTQLATCSASDLTTALDLFNTQFDEQGTVVACPTGTVTILLPPPPTGGTTCAALDTYLSAPGKAQYTTPCIIP